MSNVLLHLFIFVSHFRQLKIGCFVRCLKCLQDLIKMNRGSSKQAAMSTVTKYRPIFSHAISPCVLVFGLHFFFAPGRDGRNSAISKNLVKSRTKLQNQNLNFKQNLTEIGTKFSRKNWKQAEQKCSSRTTLTSTYIRKCLPNFASVQHRHQLQNKKLNREMSCRVQEFQIQLQPASSRGQ